MFSIFPPLLYLSGFAPLFLRLTLGSVFVLWAYKRFKTDKIKSIPEGLIGICLILGLATQLAALIAAIILGIRLVKKIKEKAFLTDGVNYYLILFIISISLIFTGAGFIAFDLPL